MPIVSAQMDGGKWTPHALGLRNFAMYRYAEEFHDTALKAGSPLVRAYLLGHALELYLKAYLLHSGFRTTKLKQEFGHSLKALLREAEIEGLGAHLHITAELRDDLARLNKVYISKALQYFSVLYLLVPPTVPKLVRMFRFATSLRKTVGRLIRNTT